MKFVCDQKRVCLRCERNTQQTGDQFSTPFALRFDVSSTVSSARGERLFAHRCGGNRSREQQCVTGEKDKSPVERNVERDDQLGLAPLLPLYVHSENWGWGSDVCGRRIENRHPSLIRSGVVDVINIVEHSVSLRDGDAFPRCWSWHGAVLMGAICGKRRRYLYPLEYSRWNVCLCHHFNCSG